MCRSQPGYWISSQSDSHGVVACPVPSVDRCVGWNSSSARSQCGAPYGPSSPGCTGCAPGYYSSLQICLQCPPSNSSMVLEIVKFIIVLSSLFVVIFILVMLVTRRYGGSFGNGVFRARDFVAWTMLTWQTIVQVGHCCKYRVVFLLCLHDIPSCCVVRSANAPPEGHALWRVSTRYWVCWSWIQP